MNKPQKSGNVLKIFTSLVGEITVSCFLISAVSFSPLKKLTLWIMVSVYSVTVNIVGNGIGSWDQILDDVACVSLHVLGKEMNSSPLHSLAMGK